MTSRSKLNEQTEKGIMYEQFITKLLQQIKDMDKYITRNGLEKQLHFFENIKESVEQLSTVISDLERQRKLLAILDKLQNFNTNININIRSLDNVSNNKFLNIKSNIENMISNISIQLHSMSNQ